MVPRRRLAASACPNASAGNTFSLTAGCVMRHAAAHWFPQNLRFSLFTAPDDLNWNVFAHCSHSFVTGLGSGPDFFRVEDEGVVGLEFPSFDVAIFFGPDEVVGGAFEHSGLMLDADHLMLAFVFVPLLHGFPF